MADYLHFGKYNPDTSSYKADSASLLQNVFPRGDGYGPVPDFSSYSAALSAACRGAFLARNADGTFTIFAGTSTKLYKLNNSDFSWTDVSKGSSTYTTLPTVDQWQFAQFNNFVFAVQLNAPVQVFDLTSSTNFADLGGSPPQARYIAVVNRFVVLTGLSSTAPYRIQWSGLNATTTWTTDAATGADFQDLPDGGLVRSIAGGEYGTITQDGAIRRMVFAPGSAFTFQIERVSDSKGIAYPLSLVRAGDMVFYWSVDGFMAITPGGLPTPIGKERVDRTALAAADGSAPQLILGVADPNATRVHWVCRSKGMSTSLFDSGLTYDYGLDRWSPLSYGGEYITSSGKPGITLESLDTISGSIDALTTPLDDISTVGATGLAGFDATHKLGFYSGNNLEAILVTPEQTADRRSRVRGFRPVTDAATCYGSVGYRERLQDTVQYSAEQTLTAEGRIWANVSTRLASGKIRIPAGTDWTFASGIEPDIAIEGKR